MASYDILKNILQSKIYQNSAQAISGTVLQDTLTSFINTLGVNSNFMGLLSSGNKPSASVDGKQFYIGINSSATTVNVDCSAVGLGTIAITQSTLWLVYSDATGWHKTDLAAGLAAAITPGDGQTKLTQNGFEIGSFSANQSTNSQIPIPTTKVTLVDGNRQELGSFFSSEKQPQPIEIVIPIGGGGGGVTSVALSMPTGFAVSGSPITSNGTLTVAFASGFSLPSISKQDEWDAAYRAINKNIYNAEDPGDGNTLDGDCVIESLEPNAVYYLTNVTSLVIRSYDYDDSTFECTQLPETYIIMESNDMFEVDVNDLANVYRVDGTPLEFDAGKSMYIVRGNVWEAKVLA